MLPDGVWSTILAAAAILAALGGIGAAVRWLVIRLRKLGHLADDLLGEPARPGQEARPGLMDRVKTLEARTAELRPNGGHSIKDTVDRIEQRLVAVERTVVPDQPPARKKRKK